MGIQLYETSAKENINVEEVSYLTHFVNFLNMICFSLGKNIAPKLPIFVPFESQPSTRNNQNKELQDKLVLS